MKLAIKVKHVVNVINFLDGLGVRGLKSIHRTNLSMKLQEKLKVISKNEKQMRDELKDDKELLREELSKFIEEEVVVDGGDSQTMLQTVKSIIKEVTAEDSSVEFKNEDAYAVAVLYEAFDL